MESCRSGARSVEGAAAARFSQLCGGDLGPERVRRINGARWPALEKFRTMMFQTMILAGDIGGTNARLALYQQDNNNDDSQFVAVHEKVFASKEFRGLDEIVLKFVSETGVRPSVASFGIAGPVRNGRVETSNLPWVIESSRLAQELQLETVELINDLEAQAWGIQCLGGAD